VRVGRAAEATEPGMAGTMEPKDRKVTSRGSRSETWTPEAVDPVTVRERV
jgi:hypothetical protein